LFITFFLLFFLLLRNSINQKAEQDKWWGDIFPKLQLMLRNGAIAALDKKKAHRYPTLIN
jgi:hypothetical protein